MISGIDHVVGRVRKALDAKGVSENTLIVFRRQWLLSGTEGFAGKWSHYEESLRGHSLSTTQVYRHTFVDTAHRCTQQTYQLLLLTMLTFPTGKLPGKKPTTNHRRFITRELAK